MEYINNPERLLRISETLSEHGEVVKRYFLASLYPRVTVVRQPKDRLRILFTIANADRQGTGSENKTLRQATATFCKYLDEKVAECSRLEPHEAHRTFLEFLCNIDGMNQKTANLFLKYLAMFQREFGLGILDWHSWESILHVPLDIWVLRLLGKDFLAVCNQRYEDAFRKVDRERSKRKGETIEDYPSPLLHEDRYRDLQADFAEIASLARKPAITLDNLWFVGSNYCTLRPLLCELCWLRTECHWGEIAIIWSVEATKLKSEKVEERKHREKSFRQILSAMKKEYMSDNPGKTDSDFHNFLNSETGKEWMSEFLRRIPRQ